MEPQGADIKLADDVNSGTKMPAAALKEAANALQDAAAKLQGTQAPQVPQVPEQAFGSPAAASPAPSKVLDFGAKPATPATPITPFPSKLSDEDVDYDAFIKSTLLWDNKVRSAIYLVVGLLLIVGTKQALMSKVPLVTVACYAVLAQMALNFFRSVVNPAMQERATYADSAYTHWAITQTTNVVRAAAAVHDSHLRSTQPMKTLQIVVSLWLLSMVSRVVSPFYLLAVVYVLLFVLPKAYVSSKDKVDATVNDVTTKAKDQFSRMDVRAKAALIVVPVLLVGYLCRSRADMAVATFVALAYLRTQFKQSDVDAKVKLVADKTQFVTNTAAKVKNTISNMAATYADKYELTPTPSKKKAQ